MNTNNNWIEEQVNSEIRDNIKTFVTPTSHVNSVGIINFISNLLTKKDQEHKAELESIKGEIGAKLKQEPDSLEDYIQNQFAVEYNSSLQEAISILDSHINKQL